ncbi:MAG: sugar O-acetyltransferase [Oscillospiraceae bacterium]|nr:sugar O-acetyltransferase [Oscillospiraceae bacterium]
MNEKEKLLSGKLYDSSDPVLVRMREKAHRLSLEYNQFPETETRKRNVILRELLPHAGKDLYLQSPIQFDYGEFTTFGDRCYANFNLVILDCAPVQIGNDVFIGANCTIATPMHPFLPGERNMQYRPDGSVFNLEYAKPVTIRDNCWIACNVTICGGVTIGAGTIIGAGSVVTRDIPPNVLAAGNPCRVIRELTEADSIRNLDLI